jgi:hypothetical protein
MNVSTHGSKIATDFRVYEVVYPFDQELDNILGLRLRPYLRAIRFPDWEPETCPCREWFEGILRC